MAASSTTTTNPFLKTLSMSITTLHTPTSLFTNPKSLHFKKPTKNYPLSLSFTHQKPTIFSSKFVTFVADQESASPNAVVLDDAQQDGGDVGSWDVSEPQGLGFGSEGESESGGGAQQDGGDVGSWDVSEPQGLGFGSEGESESGGGEESLSEPPEDAKLFVGNLPYDVDSEKLAHMFDEAGVVEISEVIYNRETDRSRGFGFVTMSTVEEAEKAVEKFNGFELNGRYLTVNKAAPRGARPERPQREFEPSFRIYVGNLPWEVDNARLEQVFSEHGKVISARVVSDRETGRSRGFGFVTMASETEMNDAIAALDGQTLEGRAIRVNVAEERPPRRTF